MSTATDLIRLRLQLPDGETRGANLASGCRRVDGNDAHKGEAMEKVRDQGLVVVVSLLKAPLEKSGMRTSGAGC